MTYFNFSKYRWCDDRGHWHSGYPDRDCDWTKIEGCDRDGYWRDCEPAPEPTCPPADNRDGLVEGTSGNDVIDVYYNGDPDGDRIDANDAILAGEAPQDDIVYGYGGNDTIRSGEGDDDVYGGEGDDWIDGGKGNDKLFGGKGHDTIYGGDGDDYIDASSGLLNGLPDRGYPGLYAADTNPNDDKDVVYGGAGNDTIITGDDADYIEGGSGNDRIYAGYDDDTIKGDGGNDYIVAGEGSDTVYGGDGNDEIWGGIGPDYDFVNIRDDQGDKVTDNGKDVIHGGAGDDVIHGQDDDDILYGDDGRDTLYGDIDDDELYGGKDDDTLYGGQGSDRLDGGEGADQVYGGDDQDLFVNVTAGDNLVGGEGYSTDPSQDCDTLDLSGSGPLRIIYSSTDPANLAGTVEFLDAEGHVTGSATFSEMEHVIPCFTPGSLIATPKGERPVEELKVGDRVITRDNGIQEIRWVGAKTLDWRALGTQPHLKPILIRKGALGHGLPERDMLVSPNHRVLVANDQTQLYFEEREVLVAAKHLVNNAGVSVAESLGTTYLHFMFDHHEVVLSDGAWTESFQPGDYTLKGIGNAQRAEILSLFPELKDQAGIEGYASARRTLKKHEAQMLLK